MARASVALAVATAGYFWGLGSASTPYLDIVQERLRQLAPASEGKLWQLTSGNTLDSDWLLQSPDCWGNPDPDKNCGSRNAPGAKRLAQQIQDDIASATKWVDITTLADAQDIATGIFHEAIVQGIQQAFAKNPNVTFRLLGGTAIHQSNGMAAAYAARLLKDLGNASAGARVFVTGIEPYWTFSWNHAKIVAVDGRSAIVGGHNLLDEAYNSDHPTNDVSMRVEGPAALAAHKFADVLWNYSCTHVSDTRNVGFAPFPSVAKAACPHQSPALTPPSCTWFGCVDVLALGIMGEGMDPIDNTSGAPPPAKDSNAECSSVKDDDFNDDPRFGVDNPDLVARRTLLASAKKTIFIAQQDLVFDYCNWWDFGFVSATYDTRLFSTLAQKLQEGVLVTIVVSTPLEVGNTDGFSYMNDLHEIPTILLRKMAELNMSTTVAHAALCQNLRLASVRIAKNMTKWASGYYMAQHAKTLLVDDSVFYIGSHNLYPTTLQEFGYFVEDSSAALHFREAFFDNLWLYSQESAIIDRDTGICNTTAVSASRHDLPIHKDTSDGFVVV